MLRYIRQLYFILTCYPLVFEVVNAMHCLHGDV